MARLGEGVRDREAADTWQGEKKARLSMGDPWTYASASITAPAIGDGFRLHTRPQASRRGRGAQAPIAGAHLP